MDDLEINGHVRKVSQDQLNQPIRLMWYLPPHPVLDPNKPEKVPVVFDCAAK